jgi:hypothetical protein
MMGKIRPLKPSGGHKISLSVSANVSVSHGSESPTFCFRYVDPSNCITLCDKGDIVAFAGHLRRFSQMTWNDIIQADRHKLGREKIATASLKRPIPKHLPEDTTFIALRFSGMKPMVGYQTGRTFHAVWFDRDMKSVYNHG